MKDVSFGTNWSYTKLTGAKERQAVIDGWKYAKREGKTTLRQMYGRYSTNKENAFTEVKKEISLLKEKLGGECEYYLAGCGRWTFSVYFKIGNRIFYITKSNNRVVEDVE